MPFMSQFRPPWTSLVIQIVKNPPPVEETQVQSLGQEDPLEKGMTTHSSIVAWRIPWTEKPGGLQPMGITKSQTRLSDQHFHFHCLRRRYHLHPGEDRGREGSDTRT